MATISIPELATELGTDGRTARKFLRSIKPKDAQPGKGGRWSIEKREVRALKSQFAKYTEALETARANRANSAPVEGEEPTDEELAEIDSE